MPGGKLPEENGTQPDLPEWEPGRYLTLAGDYVTREMAECYWGKMEGEKLSTLKKTKGFLKSVFCSTDTQFLIGSILATIAASGWQAIDHGASLPLFLLVCFKFYDTNWSDFAKAAKGKIIDKTPDIVSSVESAQRYGVLANDQLENFLLNSKFWAIASSACLIADSQSILTDGIGSFYYLILVQNVIRRDSRFEKIASGERAVVDMPKPPPKKAKGTPSDFTPNFAPGQA